MRRLRLAAMGFGMALLLCGTARADVIPRQAERHRALLVRSARAVWGLDAPVATFGAQVHTESRWRTDAVSPAGAQGLSQFMPSTAAWIGGVAPDLGPARPWNPGWSLRALCVYDRWLFERVAGADGCERMAMALSAYNGGLGWTRKDTALAGRRGLPRDVWFDGVETVNAGRSARAVRENRAYVRRILLDLEPEYEAAGWGPGMCGGRLRP